MVCQWPSRNGWHRSKWEWCAKYSVGTQPGRALDRTLIALRKNLLGIGHSLCYGDPLLGMKVLCTKTLFVRSVSDADLCSDAGEVLEDDPLPWRWAVHDCGRDDEPVAEVLLGVGREASQPVMELGREREPRPERQSLRTRGDEVLADDPDPQVRVRGYRNGRR